MVYPWWIHMEEVLSFLSSKEESRSSRKPIGDKADGNKMVDKLKNYNTKLPSLLILCNTN